MTGAPSMLVTTPTTSLHWRVVRIESTSVCSPTSEGAWASGAKALRIEGGCMHIHANVKEERVESEGNRILASIREILGVMPELTHVERVKWYAPRVLHAVYDLRVPAR